MRYFKAEFVGQSCERPELCLPHFRVVPLGDALLIGRTELESYRYLVWKDRVNIYFLLAYSQRLLSNMINTVVESLIPGSSRNHTMTLDEPARRPGPSIVEPWRLGKRRLSVVPQLIRVNS